MSRSSSAPESDRTPAEHEVPVPVPVPAPADVERSALWVRLVVAAVAVVALGVTGALGGLEKVPRTETPLPTAAVNQAFDAGPWRLTVTNAAFVRELGVMRPETEGNLLLAVAVIVEITADETRHMTDAVELSGVTGLVDSEPETRLIRDSTLIFKLQPGLPERIAFVWEVAAGTPAPAQVAVVLNGATRRRVSFTFLNGEMWLDDGPRAQVRVPVADRTATP